MLNRIKQQRWLGLVSLVLTGLLMSCSTTPVFDTQQIEPGLTPPMVLAEPNMHTGKLALWGGTILDTRNLTDSTQIEVLAYPLNSSQRPMQDQKPQGRFIIKHSGYLEPSIYAQGRWVSVSGEVSDIQTGKVGETEYQYPVIQAQKLHLWSQPYDRSRGTFHFGIGIGIQR